MAAERYVVLGLALPRSPWFRDVGQWATAGALPLEFVKCLSAEDLAARVQSGRAFSALLVDGAVSGLDRDLIERTRHAGCTVVVVGDERRDWRDAGADAVLPSTFDERGLLDVLRTSSVAIGRIDAGPVDAQPVVTPMAWHGRVAAVCGTGGTGVSTASIALAQTFAADARNGAMVVLADLARPGEQAVLHDARDVVPGIEELVEAHRNGTPSASDIRSHTFLVEQRGYSLLLGLRRARSWSALRPRAVEAAIDGLARSFRLVVCDCDGDVEGEAEGGSADVEDRNAMARAATTAADVVFVVGIPGVKGVHSLVRLIGDLMATGVEGGRIVAVVNRAPRNQRARAELSRAIAALTPSRRTGLSSPVFLPDRSPEDALRDGTRLHSSLGLPLARAFEAVTERGTDLGRVDPEPELIAPGSLGHWTEEADAG